MTLSTYHGHPGEIISHAVWLYHRFNLSFRNVEEILVSRGVDITYESVRQWCFRFGTEYAKRIRSRAGRQGDTWHLDEVFINIKGRQYYLWRAVDQDGDVLDRLISAMQFSWLSPHLFFNPLICPRCVERCSSLRLLRKPRSSGGSCVI